MNIEKLAGTPSGQQRKSYITTSPLKNALQSILVRTLDTITCISCANIPFQKGPLKHPGLIGKQGNISQLGGEFVLGPGKHLNGTVRPLSDALSQALHAHLLGVCKIQRIVSTLLSLADESYIMSPQMQKSQSCLTGPAFGQHQVVE